MSIRPIKTHHTFEVISDQIRDEARSGVLGMGDRLPNRAGHGKGSCRKPTRPSAKRCAAWNLWALVACVGASLSVKADHVADTVPGGRADRCARSCRRTQAQRGSRRYRNCGESTRRRRWHRNGFAREGEARWLTVRSPAPSMKGSRRHAK